MQEIEIFRKANIISLCLTQMNNVGASWILIDKVKLIITDAHLMKDEFFFSFFAPSPE